MKLKRFTAPDMRKALAMIKEELGPDAVIMSNKRLEDGVEIVAGIEEKETNTGNITQQALGEQSALSRLLKDDEVTIGGNTKPKENKSNNQEFAKSLLEILERQKQVQEKLKEQEKQKVEPAAKVVEEVEKPEAPAPLFEQSELQDIFGTKKKQDAEEKHGISSYVQDTKESSSLEFSKMHEEISSIKRLLQFELAGLLSDHKKREEPVKAMIFELLKSLGFDSDICDELSANIDIDASFNLALRQLVEQIEKRLHVGSDEIVNEGGIVTLVGPAGVGKTTTLVKLAARFVMKYGDDKVAIVTSDHFRIGAVEQLKTYGKIMGCEAYDLDSLENLPKLLYSLKEKSLVLLDTAGVGLNDDRFGTQLAMLKEQSKLKLKHYLVLPATAQRKVLEKAYEHFESLKLRGLILTKADEGESFADAVSLCLKQNLMLSYVTNGQKVPEDIMVPKAHSLAVRVLSAAQSDAAQFVLKDL